MVLGANSFSGITRLKAWANTNDGLCYRNARWGMPFLLASYPNHRAFRSEAYDLIIGVDTKVSYNKTNALC
jgi:hypothetical protein